MEYQLYTLENGLRVVHRPYATKGITHCCLVIQAGSRDEPEGKEGLAHFTEHMLFKGTHLRNNRQIVNRLEMVGGEINAYTTKEYICLHASFLDEYLERALELLVDMTFRSSFPVEEIEREKGVITDELDSYRDIPEEYLMDDFDEILFRNHSLGNNILGTKTSIAHFNQLDFKSFIKDYFTPSHIILGVYGSVSEAKLSRLVNRYFATLPGLSSKSHRILFEPVAPVQKQIKVPIHQTHGMLGGISYSQHVPERLPMLLLMNLLGGPGMSSKLNMEIREKKGICYQIEANYTPLSDTGIFSIYFGTDPDKQEKCLQLIHKELKRLIDQPLSSLYLHQSKARFKGQIALADENHPSVLISLCKSVQDYGYAESIQEIFDKIDKISVGELQEVSRIHFDPDRLSSLLIAPQD